MIKGVTENEEKIVKNVLKDYPYTFYYYGSRVKGDFTKSSDLDILAESAEDIKAGIIDEIEMKFNESRIPYVVKISDKAKIENYFYELIKPSLVKIEF